MISIIDKILHGLGSFGLNKSRRDGQCAMNKINELLCDSDG